MKDRTFILLSVPSDFINKITGFINNVNMLNNESPEPPVKIEKIFFEKKQEFAATPKKIAAEPKEN